jgi:hypothetical protein
MDVNVFILEFFTMVMFAASSGILACKIITRGLTSIAEYFYVPAMFIVTIVLGCRFIRRYNRQYHFK